MFENTIRRMPRPQDAATMTTQELRETFQVAGLFAPGELRGTFTDLDRLVVGGVMPVKPVELPNHKETGRAFFLERREFGAINVGGAGRCARTANIFNSTGWIVFICRWAPSRSRSRAKMRRIRRSFIF
jgi:4-deoxy-L-threo-5-hexosulose-uronate ketol-isomerase